MITEVVRLVVLEMVQQHLMMTPYHPAATQLMRRRIDRNELTNLSRGPSKSMGSISAVSIC